MRFNPRLILTVLFSLFFLTAVAGGLLWANLNFVQKAPGGADFYVLWQGTRNFSMQGSLPYDDLTAQIAGYAYGLALSRVEGTAAQTSRPLPRFNLPLYLVFLYIPFALVKDPQLARAVWMVFLEFELLGLVLLVFQLIRWEPAWPYLATLFLFGVFWAPAVASLFSGNVIIFQAVLLFGAIRAMQFDADELAGALLALAWFNLEAIGLLIVLVLFWALSLRRWRVWGGFLMTILLLIGISILFNTSWPLPFLTAILANWSANASPSTFSVFNDWLPGIGVRLAQGLTLAAALMLIMEWRAARGRELRWLLWTVSLTAAATPLLGMPFSPLWAVLSLPALLVVLSIMDQHWGAAGRWSAVALFLVVFFGLWRALQGGDGSAFVLFFPALLIFLLYWVRWWAIREPRLWADMISDLGK
jgi:hypothetical protein